MTLSRSIQNGQRSAAILRKLLILILCVWCWYWFSRVVPLLWLLLLYIMIVVFSLEGFFFFFSDFIQLPHCPKYKKKWIFKGHWKYSLIANFSSWWWMAFAENQHELFIKNASWDMHPVWQRTITWPTEFDFQNLRDKREASFLNHLWSPATMLIYGYILSWLLGTTVMKMIGNQSKS